MMNIVIFKDITTEEALCKLEEDGKALEGLYVDMNEKEQRRYVKDNAVLINDIIKKVDRSRIDQKKAFGISVEAEAKAITDRLEAANLPFSMLIDAYKHERAQILAAEKAKTEAAALVLQIEADHEHALLMDKAQASEAKEREQQRIDRDKKIADDAAADARIEAAKAAQAQHDAVELEKQQAIQREEQAKAKALESERQRIAAVARAKVEAEQAEARAIAEAERAAIRAQEQAEAAVKAEQDRIAEVARLEAEEQAKRDRNTKHKSGINRQAVADLVANAGVTEAQAKEVVKAIAKRQISAISISY